jgi:hypothetical protein
MDPIVIVTIRPARLALETPKPISTRRCKGSGSRPRVPHPEIEARISLYQLRASQELPLFEEKAA